MILAVFIICLCSGFILQLFMFSRALNSKANDIDNSSILLLDAMEISKNSATINKYIRNEFFDGAIITTNEDNEKSKILKAYDKNWNAIFLKKTGDFPQNAKYILEINIDKIERLSKEQAILTFVQDVNFATTYGDSSGLKFNIDGKVYQKDKEDEILADLSTVSYFGNNIR